MFSSTVLCRTCYHARVISWIDPRANASRHIAKRAFTTAPCTRKDTAPEAKSSSSDEDKPIRYFWEVWTRRKSLKKKNDAVDEKDAKRQERIKDMYYFVR